MSGFEPIAIVGQACVLPGALSPEALWQAVNAGRDLLSTVPPGYWRVDPALVLTHDAQRVDDHTWTDRGGYVRGFEALFDPGGFALPVDQIQQLDPLVHWLLHCGREALSGIAASRMAGLRRRAGVIVGNLSYPSSSLSRLAESIWFDHVLPRSFLDGRARELAGIQRPTPINRFMSGLPVQLLARALELEGGGFALDAACASSLYAVKLACDRLHDRRADLMLAGGVNRADDLFIHIGFCALQAMSRSGRSRPFHREADGLMPAEGAALLALRRLDDAVADGDGILGVIRAIGLSNDGRGRGLLAPCPLGQERAMRLAYEQSGLEPRSVSVLECHATGTPVGDGVEVRSVARVFDHDLALGSLKSNLGHLITTSGAAAMIKILAAMREQIVPPSLHAEDPLPELADTSLRVQQQAEPWEQRQGPRRAGINNFGFGGNNAHLVLEQWQPAAAPTRLQGAARGPAPSGEVAVVALQAMVAGGVDLADFTADLFLGRSRITPGPGAVSLTGGWATQVELPLTGLRFPPNDLDETLGQQLMVLRTALLALQQCGPLPRERTAVLIGMQCDAEVARYGARLRMPGWARDWSRALGLDLDEDWLARARRGVGFLRKAAGVVGAMPNISANRINSQFDLAGPGFTVSAEELSGLVCLELAARALRAGELDAAVVGAVDLCCEPVHALALGEIGAVGRDIPGDAAVVLVLKRLEDARREGDTIHAVLSDTDTTPGLRLGLDHEQPGVAGSAPHSREQLSLTPQFGHAHAASGLVHLAAAVLACEHRASPGGVGKPARPWWPSHEPRSVELQIDSIGGVRSRAVVETCDAPRPLVLQPLPRLQLYEGPHLTRLVPTGSDWAERGILDPPRHPRQRLVLMAHDETELAQQEARARQLLQQEGVSGELAPGIYYYPRPLQGELAFVFTGPAGVYPGMGRELVLAFPELLARLHHRCNCVEQTSAWVYDPEAEEAALGPHEKLWGSSYLSQLHAEVSRHLLGLQPRAAMGFCSGETNALFAMGAWNDLDTFYPALLEAGVFSRHIAGELRVLREPWRLAADEPARWISWRVLVPEEQVLEALGQEPRCHLTIVNAPGDVIIGGEPEACRRVVERVGRSRAYRLGYDVAIHCPEFASYGSDWRRLHLRPTTPVPDVRFYSVASGEHYQASAEAAADALTNMAMGRVDFPRLVRRAHADGVRVFLEHGPRDGCTKWIGRILEGQPHLALALDDTGRSPLTHLLQVGAQLWAAGVAVQMDALLDRLAAAPRPQLSGPIRSYPAHPEPLCLPPLPAPGEQAQLMEPAPPLPPVLQAARLAEPTPPPTTPPTGHGLVAHAHRAFLQQQTAVHQQFLAMRTRSLSRLAQVCQRLPAQLYLAPVSVPAPSLLPSPATSGSTGPSFDRQQLERLASGRISSVLGPLFQQQDHHERQVRLPEPPLLLVDRVTGIAGEPGSMGHGVIWTETDVQPGAWYLHDGYMPSGIVVESGQADLLLISWLGVDFLNRGERVYRLLGCELTNHGSLPRVGETLRYEIHVDGHARAGAVRLFFFHYDCFVGGERRLTVRNAQAGFFTDEELRLSRGVLWDPATAEHKPDGRRDPALVPCTRRRFDVRQVRAFSEGRTHECFGEGFERTLSHTRTPRIQSGKMLLLDEVVQFDPDGGPWGRGYLRVDNAIHPDDWYMQGHFKNDPCMPGTLMCEGCLQAMAFFLTAMGCTVHNDGWRFEPVPDETYKLQCRGQVIPSSRKLTYEVFVEEFIAGPQPTIFADILGTCDGLKIFHGRRMGLRLVPDWPMNSMDLSQLEVDHAAAVMPDGFRFDYRSLLACAWGRPSEAFGAMATMFDGTRHIARLPGPPYHFMSRVTRVQGEMGSLRTGASIELEYDIPPDAWYFDENGAEVMPFCVLLEAVLQPCGWLAVYIGCPGSAPIDLFFRNLDGTGTVHAELPRDAGTLRTRTTLTSIARMGTTILASFEVECRVGQTLVYTLQTGFGFFPAEALASQVGLPVDDAQRSELIRPGNLELDLRRRDASTARYFEGPARLPGPMLLMLDRITGLWPDGGRAGLGRVRGDKLVDHRQWFFKAHFFQDPVQPGSLGLEAMLQLLQFYMLQQGMDREIENPRFEPIALGRCFTWKYRGQVVPERERVTVELEILERGRDDRGVYAVAESSMWVDGLRIYHSPNLAMRIVPGPAVEHDTELLDPAVDRWLQDHRPNWTLATLPLMSMVDRLAAAALRAERGSRARVRSGERNTGPREAGGQASGMQVVQVRDVQITGWLVFDGPRRLRTEAVHVEDDTYQVKLSVWREASRADLSRFEPVATGTVVLAPSYPAPPSGLPALSSTETMPDPYAAGALFHGPAFQLLRRLELGPQGSTAWLDAGDGQVPFGLLNQALLDAAVHGIVHDELERWSDRVPPKHIAYPFALRRATFHGPAPREGEVRCETRLLGFAEPAPQPDSPERFPLFQIQLLVPDRATHESGASCDRVWAELELVEVLIPMGPHADDRQKRIDFRDGRFVEGAGLSRFEGETTRLTDDEVRSRDWLRGSVAHAYAVQQLQSGGAGGRSRQSDGAAVTRELAIKDHIAQRVQAHPATVRVGADLDHGVPAAQPLTRFPVQVTRSGQEVVVTDAGPPRLDLELLRAFGRKAFGLGPWLGEDLSLGLCRQFLRRVVLDDPVALEPLRNTSLLLLGNHQVQIESMIFPMVATAVLGRHIVTVAKEEHRTGWIGPLSSFTYSHPGVDYPRVIIYFDQKNPASMFGVLEQLRRELTREQHSVFVHVEGELALRCGLAVERISSVFIDLAQELQIPIVPVRLVRGLPLEPLHAPLDFPLGFTQQDFHLGRPLLPDELRELPYAERRRRVLDALNHVGPPLEQERPGAPDPEFTRRVEQIERDRGLDPVRAVVLAILEQTPAPSEQTRQLLEQVQSDGANGNTTTNGWLEQARRWLAGR